MKKIEVQCPSCKKTFEYKTSEWRPFCSERCRLVDLGQWLTESYSVPAAKLSEEEAQTLEQLHEKNSQENSEEN